MFHSRESGRVPCFRSFSSGRFNPTPIDAIRNVAIIAHVDHGKTTLVDSLLRNAGLKVDDTRLLDQGELEREKGITILAKTTRVPYKDFILNIVDTPGHADFGGEVERILSMVDGVILVVDIASGPRAQTRFVLSKALTDPSVVPIVVVNKVDRQHGRSEGDVENEIFELFVGLNASDAQMDYPVLYASAKHGWTERTWEAAAQTNHSSGMIPLLDTIVSHVPSPRKKLEGLQPDSTRNIERIDDSDRAELSQSNITPHFSLLASMVEHSPQLGHTVTGMVYTGFLTKNASVVVKSGANEQTSKSRIREILVTQGIRKIPADIASPGDIVTLQLSSSTVPAVYDTIAGSSAVPLLPFRAIDPPMIGIDVRPNTSPYHGEDGVKGSLFDLKTRLQKEALGNVGIHVEEDKSKSAVTLKGRGDLQLGILLETMRREGYEFEVTSPEIVFRYDDKGKPLEPWERFTILVPSMMGPDLMQQMMNRRADPISTNFHDDEMAEYVFDCASRHFFGMSSWLQGQSRGTATITSEPIGYKEYVPAIDNTRANLVIATSPGIVVAFEIIRFQKDCTFFVSPNDRVYEGMILGQTTKDDDLLCNICKPRKVVYVRVATKTKEDPVKPAVPLTIEYCLGYIQNDELVEVTPKRIVMRKKILSNDARNKQTQKACKATA